MAVSSNRSPSPVSARPNPNSRTPESNNPIRRSFSGNPFNKPSILSNPRCFNPTTPSNSPSDFGQRNSIDRNGGSLRDNEEKENEKEQGFKTVKIRSQAVSKGSKHFMSPTISAASKITAASPRKKVLTDRNEPLRTSSVSFSDGKSLSYSMTFSDNMEDYDSKSEICSNQNKIEPSVDSDKMGVEATLIPKAPKIKSSNRIETESSVSTVTHIDPNHVNGDFNARFMISPRPNSSCSRCPILTPLDADPSVPPYDPKTNYLSPRPQFLHYRPNPRVGVYLNNDNFNFESFSDTETTDETESEDSQKESEEEKEPGVSEPGPVSTNLPTKTVEAKGVSKKHFCLRYKSISLLLMLVVACLSISVADTPVNGTPVFKDQTFPKLNDPYEIAKFAQANFDGLARKFFRFWSADSISYIAKLIQLPKEVQKLGVLQFYNLTALQEDFFHDGYLMIDISNEVGEDKYKQNELGPVREVVEVEIGSLEEKSHTEIGADKNIVDVSESQNGEEVEDRVYPERETDTEVVLEEHECPKPEEQMDLTLETEVTEDKIPEADEMFIHDNSDITLQSNAELQEQFSEVQSEAPKDNYLESCIETESIKTEETPDYSKSIVTNEISQHLETLDSTVNRSESKLSVHNILGILLFSLILVAASALVYAKQIKSSIPNAAIPIQKFSDIDMGSESCSSEMSSFQKCSSYSKRRAGNHEGLEKKIRRSSKRESLASSSNFSMDSPSYGSFTTYEIIHKKHGDEEAATPVRRSSRIRSQVTSP